MRISARADYAVRAMLELAAAPAGVSLTAREIATAQGIPKNFLENILTTLRQTGLVRTHRGPLGGSMLARPANEIVVADVMCAVEGSLTEIRDRPASELDYPGAAGCLPALWCSLASRVEDALRAVTLADLVPATGGSQRVTDSAG